MKKFEIIAKIAMTIFVCFWCFAGLGFLFVSLPPLIENTTIAMDFQQSFPQGLWTFMFALAPLFFIVTSIVVLILFAIYSRKWIWGKSWIKASKHD